MEQQKRLLIHGARILNPARGEDYIGNILISGDRISAVSENLYDADAEVIEAKGLTAVPGFVDMHVHLRDPGFTDKEDIYTGCRAAAAGGILVLSGGNSQGAGHPAGEKLPPGPCALRPGAPVRLPGAGVP